MVLPATVPNLIADPLWLDQGMLFGIDAVAAETGAPQLIEATHLQMFVKLAQAKQDVIAALLTKGRDTRVRRKKAATPIDFWAHCTHFSEIVRQRYP